MKEKINKTYRVGAHHHLVVSWSCGTSGSSGSSDVVVVIRQSCWLGVDVVGYTNCNVPSKCMLVNPEWGESQL